MAFTAGGSYSTRIRDYPLSNASPCWLCICSLVLTSCLPILMSQCILNGGYRNRTSTQSLYPNSKSPKLPFAENMTPLWSLHLLTRLPLKQVEVSPRCSQRKGIFSKEICHGAILSHGGWSQQRLEICHSRSHGRRVSKLEIQRSLIDPLQDCLCNCWALCLCDLF